MAPRQARIADADHRGAGVPEGGGVVRRGGRGCAAPGGHPGPPDADLDRIPAPRGGLRARGRRGRCAGAGLERRGHRPRGDDVHGPGGGRGAVADRSPTTSRPMRCAPPRRRRAPRSSNRCRSIERDARAVAGARRAGPGAGAAARRDAGAGRAARLGSAIRAEAKVLAGEVVSPTGRWSTRRRSWRRARTSICIATCPTRCRCRSTCRCCTATTTSWWWTSRTSWRRCRAAGTWRRRRLVRLRRELDLPEL